MAYERMHVHIEPPRIHSKRFCGENIREKELCSMGTGEETGILLIMDGWLKCPLLIQMTPF